MSKYTVWEKHSEVQRGLSCDLQSPSRLKDRQHLLLSELLAIMSKGSFMHIRAQSHPYPVPCYLGLWRPLELLWSQK